MSSSSTPPSSMRAFAIPKSKSRKSQLNPNHHDSEDVNNSPSTSTPTHRSGRSSLAGPSSSSRATQAGPGFSASLLGTPSRPGKGFYSSGSSSSAPNLSHLASSSSSSLNISNGFNTPVHGRSSLRYSTTTHGGGGYGYGNGDGSYTDGSVSSPYNPTKSTIVPFDLKANERAGEEARAKKSEGAGAGGDVFGGSVGGKAPAGVKRRGFVRKRSLYDRISSFPYELIDSLTPDSYTPPPSYAIPISMTLHTIHLLALLGTGIDLWGNKAKAKNAKNGGSLFKDSNTPEVKGRPRYEEKSGLVSVGVFAWLLFIILMIISISNAVYLFCSSRRYDMNYRTESLNTPNAKAIPAPEVQYDSSRDPLLHESSLKGLGKKLWSVSKQYFHPMVLLRYALGWPQKQSKLFSQARHIKTIQSLNVWDPPEFNALFFTYYSPILPLTIHLIAPSHFYQTIFFVALLILQTRFIISNFEQLIKDKLILQREVMREYDQVFVYKNLVVAKVDKAVQTNEAEML